MSALTTAGADAGIATPVVPARQPHLWHRALRQPRTQIGLILTGFVALVAFVGPLVAPHSAGALIGPPYSHSVHGALLGTDYLGEDVFSRVLRGGISVIWISTAGTVMGVGLGAAIGMLAGYSRNWLDGVLMRLMDVLLAFPAIVLVLLFISMVGPKEWLIAVIVGLSWTPQVARVARGATLELTGKEYIQAAVAIGTPTRRIILREVLPNVTTPLTVEFGLRLTWSIGLVTAISFLGAGLQPPAADWGLMIKQNFSGITIQPWGVIAPIAMISIFCFGTNFVTEGLARAIAGVGPSGRSSE